ncbi:MAG: hypothetical protein ACREM2_00290 [Vulcanimicrobiaceae bacterium]
MLRITIAALLLVAFCGLRPTLAQDVAFAGPSGWSQAPAISAGPQHTIAQWHLAGDVQSVTFIKDETTTYADALAAVERNFAQNHIKPAIDKDIPCQGQTAHVVEFTFGPSGHGITTNRIIVPDGSGVVTITYARSFDESFDPSVQKSEAAYCAASATASTP